MDNCDIIWEATKWCREGIKLLKLVMQENTGVKLLFR